MVRFDPSPLMGRPGPTSTARNQVSLDEAKASRSGPVDDAQYSTVFEKWSAKSREKAAAAGDAGDAGDGNSAMFILTPS